MSAHRPPHEDENLHEIFTLLEQRKVTENVTLRHKGNAVSFPTMEKDEARISQGAVV